MISTRLYVRPVASLPQMGKVGEQNTPVCAAHTRARIRSRHPPSGMCFPRSCIHRTRLMHMDICTYIHVRSNGGRRERRAGAVRRHRWRSITREGEGIGVRVHPDDGPAGGREEARAGGEGRRRKKNGGKRKTEMVVKRHHKSLPAVSPRPTALIRPPPPPTESVTLFRPMEFERFPPLTTSRAIRPWP